MKTTNQKYEEAIIRNLTSFKARFVESSKEDGAGLEKFSKDTLESLKIRIGIRQRDTMHDSLLTGLLAEAKNKVEAKKNEVKTEKNEVKAKAEKKKSKTA